MNNQYKSNVHFRVPENYFQEFSDRLHSHIQLEKRLGQTSDGFKMIPGDILKKQVKPHSAMFTPNQKYSIK